MLRDYKGAESIEATDPNTDVARQFAQASHKRVGRVLAGKYELIRTVGVGGMGAVFEARHQLTGRHVAVKLIHTALAENRAHVTRFMREAKAASEIGHPAIVDVLDAGTTDDGLVYMVLELLKGEDLEDAVRHGRLTTPEVLQVAIDVLDCLAAAHDRGIVHRDIKPENVFLAVEDDGSRRTKVLDFGIAKHLREDADTSMTRTGTIVGTPDFMSPEQARGDAVDGRTDLWAVGALLFYALTGDPPFVAENYNKLIIQIVTEDVPSIARRRPDLPAELVAAIDRTMRRKPDERWPDARSLAAALRAIRLAEGGPSAPGPAAQAGARVSLSRSGVRAMPTADSTSTSTAAAAVGPAPAHATAVGLRGARVGLVPLLVLALIVIAVAVFFTTSLLVNRTRATAPLLAPPEHTAAAPLAPDPLPGAGNAANPTTPVPAPPVAPPDPAASPDSTASTAGTDAPRVPPRRVRGEAPDPAPTQGPQAPTKRPLKRVHDFATEYE